MRHAHVKNLTEVESVGHAHGERFAYQRKWLSTATHAQGLSCNWYEIPPGKQAFPHHYHLVSEEAFFILAGQGELRLGDDRLNVTAGDYIACPPDASGAHSIVNTGPLPLQYLAFSAACAADVVVYPDSQKFLVSAGADIHTGLKSAPFAKVLKDQPSVDYYLDED